MKKTKLKEPERKHSEVLLHFATPLLRMLPPGTPLAVYRSALQIAVTAWNAVVVDEAMGTGEHVAEVRHSMANMPPQGRVLFGAAVEELLRLKRDKFAEHRWTVGRWHVTADVGGIRLRVETHAPPTRTPSR